MKKLTYSFLAFTLLFFSCSKEELSNDSTSSQKTDQKSSKTNDLTQIITDQKGTKIYR